MISVFTALGLSYDPPTQGGVGLRLEYIWVVNPSVGFCLLRVNDSRPVVPSGHWWSESLTDSYLVDPASSHMLVSKIKPCMSKYKLSHSETANGSLDQLWFLRSYNPTWITVVILELIHESTL